MKGLILAGGTGSRLSPATLGVSKQLLPIYDKPMIFYPLVTLMRSGIREIALITLPRERSLFERVLGDGSHLGLEITYLEQAKPRGLADAFIVAEGFLAGDASCLILGDNMFFGDAFESKLSSRVQVRQSLVFAQRVATPSAYGVVSFDNLSKKAISLEEKPQRPSSNLAITGIYFLDGSAPERAKTLSPSSRGELEIVDLLSHYLHDELLEVELLPEGTVWMDTGSFESLLDASSLIRLSQQRFGTLIGSPELTAWELGYISDSELEALAQRYRNSRYGLSLLDSRAAKL